MDVTDPQRTNSQARTSPRLLKILLLLLMPQLPPLYALAETVSEPSVIQMLPPGQYRPTQEGREAATLERGRPVDGDLAGGETHVYQLTLEAGQYAKVSVAQHGIDVVAESFTPDGKLISQFNAELRLHEAEEVELVAETSGIYRVNIKAPLRGTAGRYEIQLTEIRAATEQDHLLSEAHRLDTEDDRLQRAGQFDEARLLATRALEAGEKALGPEHIYVAHLLSELGFVQRRKAEYARAEATLTRALAMSEKLSGPEHPQTVSTMNMLGLLYRSKNDLGRAARLLQQSLDITERTLGSEHPRVVQYLLNLETLHAKLNDAAQSQRDLERALKIAEKTLDPFDVLMGDVVNNLGVRYQEQGDLERSEPLLKRGLTIYEKNFGPEHIKDASALQNLGIIARQRKDYSRALEFYGRALAIQEKIYGLEHPNVASVLNNIANIYHAQGDYTHELELQQHVLSIALKALSPHHGLTMTSLGNIARAYAAQGDVGNAIQFQTRVDASHETVLALALPIGSERQKLNYLDALGEWTDRTISLNLQLAPKNQAAADLAMLVLLQRKGRVLDYMSESLTSLRQRANPADQKLLEALNSTTMQLAKLALDGRQKLSADEYQKQLTVFEERKEKLEAQISERSAEFRAQTQPVTLRAVQAAIPRDAALIEFAIYRPFDPKAQNNHEAYRNSRYVAYLMRGQSAVQYKDLGEAQAIDAAIDALRQALGDPQRRDTRELARAVDEKVMQPVRALAGDATHLLVSPDGALNLIPFEALVDERGAYLIQHYAFTYLTSGRDLLRMQVARQSPRPPVVVANPTFGEPPLIASGETVGTSNGAGSRAHVDYSQIFFGPLPGVNEEVRALKQLLPNASFLTKEQATKAALQKVVAPKILHIATHGFFLSDRLPQNSRRAAPRDRTRIGKFAAYAENPLLRSGLALAGANQSNGGNNDNGILTALEASGLNLWGTKLVVLSACDTGLGEVRNGEGVYGLRRAFVLAGAESQMMSLWPVSDQSTRELMIGYYKALVQGQGRGDALRTAQLKILRDARHSHPYYWAGFIQTGEWANLKGER